MTKSKTTPDASYLRDLLSYNPDTGLLIWKTRKRKHFRADIAWKRWNTRFAGEIAGNKHGNGFVSIRIFGNHWKAHRLIWKMVYGVEPQTIDHINGDGFDNRLENLRSVVHSENMKNKKTRSDNTSGFINVQWEKPLKKWRVRVKGQSFGCYSEKQDAVKAAEIARERLGFHPNHGRKGG